MAESNAQTLDAPSRRAPVVRGTTAFRTLIVALAVLAWLALWLWSASPYARYLDHGRWTDIGAFAAICRAIPVNSVCACWIDAPSRRRPAASKILRSLRCSSR